MMKKLYAGLSMAIAFACSGAAQAKPTPYPHPGTPNTASYVFTAQATGDITAYFAGSNASYTNEIGLLVNGVATGVTGLTNHTSAYGDKMVLGSVNAGDVLTFELINRTPGDVGPWYSDAALNADGMQHIYASTYAGDKLIPTGIAIGFEDLVAGGDLDYNDENFVFANVAAASPTPPASAVPEPASLGLMLIGALGLGLRRKAARAK
jgi:hypothetical protein